MRPKFFVIIVALAAWAWLGIAHTAQAQTPPKPRPMVPGTLVTELISNETVYQCRDDVVFLWVGEAKNSVVVARVLVLSSDPLGRPMKAFYYAGTQGAGAAPVTSFAIAAVTGVREGVSVLLEDGWFHTYAFRHEFRAQLYPSETALVTVVVLLRQKTQDCLLTKQEWVTGGKG